MRQGGQEPLFYIRSHKWMSISLVSSESIINKIIHEPRLCLKLRHYCFIMDCVAITAVESWSEHF